MLTVSSSPYFSVPPLPLLLVVVVATDGSSNSNTKLASLFRLAPSFSPLLCLSLSLYCGERSKRQHCNDQLAQQVAMKVHIRTQFAMALLVHTFIVDSLGDEQLFTSTTTKASRRWLRCVYSGIGICRYIYVVQSIVDAGGSHVVFPWSTCAKMHTLRTRDGSSCSELRSDEATRCPPSLDIVHGPRRCRWQSTAK